MALAKINNIECYYEIHGEGRPLVLIAGLASDNQSWVPGLDELKKHFKLIIFDNRAIGRTKCPPEGFDINTLAEDTVCLLDDLGIEKSHILGHSMGGYIAQAIAINHPEKVDRLVLESTAASTSERNKFLFTNLLRSLEDGVSYESFLRDLFCWIYTPALFNNKNALNALLKYALEYPYPVTIEGFKRQVEAINKFSSVDRLDRIKAETLVVVGEEDILITRKDTEALAAGISTARTVYMKNAAHAIHMEDPKRFLEVVLDFLK